MAVEQMNTTLIQNPNQEDVSLYGEMFWYPPVPQKEELLFFSREEDHLFYEEDHLCYEGTGNGRSLKATQEDMTTEYTI